MYRSLGGLRCGKQCLDGDFSWITSGRRNAVDVSYAMREIAREQELVPAPWIDTTTLRVFVQDGNEDEARFWLAGRCILRKVEVKS